MIRYKQPSAKLERKIFAYLNDASVALSAAVIGSNGVSIFVNEVLMKDFNSSRVVYNLASSCEENCFDLSLKNEVGKEMKDILSI